MSVVREDALEQENAELRGLHASLPPFIKQWQLAEIIECRDQSAAPARGDQQRRR